MGNFARVEIADFESYPDQEASVAVADVRLGSNLSAQNFSTAGPLVVNYNAGSYTVKGLHHYLEAASIESAMLYSTALAPTVEMASFIRMRTFGGGADFAVGPATRIQTDGKGCYAAELTWVAGSPGSFTISIVRYDAGTGTRNVLASTTSALTEYPAASANFGNRFYAIGIQAIGTGATITLRAFLTLLYYTGTPSLATYWDLNGMPASQTPIVSTTDATASRHVGGAHGIRGRNTGVGAGPSPARIASQWGMFVDTAGTKPSAPTITATTPSNGQRLTVAISGFSDSDPLDVHQSTRWLLYPDIGQTALTFAAPLVDTGFSTSDLLTHTFYDLDPSMRYAVRVQVKDNDGDISDYGQAVGIECTPTASEHKGMLRSARFRDRPAGNSFPTNAGFSVIEPGVLALGPTFKLAHEAPGASSAGQRVKRFATVASGQHRIFAYRDPRYIGGGPTPLYNSIMGTMVFARWPDASGFYPQVRSTAADADAYLVKKQSNGTNWEYQLYRRTLNSGGVAGPGSSAGPFTLTLLQTYTVAKRLHGSIYGERILLMHMLDSLGVGTLGLIINGYLQSPLVTNEQWGGLDPGHQWHSIRVDSTNGNWDLFQLGAVATVGQFISLPAARVYPETRDGNGIYHDPGPLMDPHDLAENNIWYQSGGKWKVTSATNAAGYLTYWAPFWAHYNYSVKAAIYGNNGVVGRFRDPDNLIVTALSGSGGTRTLVLGQVLGGIITILGAASVAYTAGAELILQVYNDPNSTDIFIRVYYDGLLVFPTSGIVQTIVGGQATALAVGLPGIVRASAVITTAEDIASSFELYEGLTLNPPNTPEGTGSSASTCLKVAATINSTAFTDPDMNTHVASQWQVTEYPSGDFLSPLFDSGETPTNLVAITVNFSTGTWRDPTDKGLNAASQYKYRVRHKDSTGLWSLWSAPEIFTTDSPDTDSPATNVLSTYPTTPPPAQAFEDTIAFRVLVSAFESGREQRRAKGTQGRRVFKLRYDPVEGPTMDIFWDFYRQTAFGPLNLFNYIHPKTGETFLARFLNDSMTRQLFEADIEKTGLAIVQVLS